MTHGEIISPQTAKVSADALHPAQIDSIALQVA